MRKLRVMLICGSPRKGNSEAVLRELEKYLKEEGIITQLLLLREKNITRCEGCVEYCNKNLCCKYDKYDDMGKILQQMEETDGFIIASPTYFSMPPAILKNFIDRSSILFTKGADLSKKVASVIGVGTDLPSIGLNVQNLITYCHVHRMILLDSLHLIGKSNLYKDYEHILKSEANGDLNKKLGDFAKRIVFMVKKINQ